MSKVYSLKKVQLLPVSLQTAWDFFSRPGNLAKITPTGMDFQVLNTDEDRQMYAGQIIEYTVKPVWGISMYWMTEITQVKELAYFIDEQRFGPYSLWHHQHHFTQKEAGVEMTDIIHYKLPLWFLGDLAHSLFVKHKLEEIFDFRYQKAEEIFGKWEMTETI